ncbi:hypothetical protein COLO4_25682 [Corchorus olitorius]|uniref:Gnk2-homologous domain-containing protein n=1 Tax=Corchorus olitorius TaxID=93759 RepID=A0A1R3I0E5_9ROSI|nr:hypothetical protein COLO4_25682 [Corchorus olitorius]
MPSMKICLVLKLLMISVFTFTTSAVPSLLYYVCSSKVGNSFFIANRNNLLSKLSNATAHDGFYNSTVGQIPYMVHGLFVCRGDVNPKNCQNCIKLIVADATQLCPNETVGLIWYDQCMLHYSDTFIFSTMKVDPSVSSPINEVNVVEADRFNQLRKILIKDITTQASKASIGAKKFATKAANYTALQTIYSLAQCTPDISSDDCYICFQTAITDLQSCCTKKPAIALFPSCTVQYDINPFYQQGNMTPDALPPIPLLFPSSTPPGKKGRIIKIVVPTVSFVVFSSLFCYVLGYGISKAKAIQSLQFDLSMIETATSNFGEVNKIGAGGFGSVYKGTLPNGQEIAVKRLSRSSGQGAQEFQNEVSVVAKLQHRNLVKLLGYCLERKERMLIYDGYMSPEYAMHGRFSEKSDVFGFGILILEIVSGKRNTGFCHTEYAENLLTYAWRHWRDGTPLELMDSTLHDSYLSNEVERCIHIGFLCIQESPNARPTMGRVALMLSSCSVSLPSPQKPGFFFGTVTRPPNFSIAEQKFDQSTNTTPSSSATVNEASITELIPR